MSTGGPMTVSHEPPLQFSTLAPIAVVPTPSVSLTGVTMTDSPPTPPVTFVVPLCASAVAAIVAVPAAAMATEVQIPEARTAATLGWSLDQATGRKNTRRPAVSRSSAVTRIESPTGHQMRPGYIVTDPRRPARRASQVPRGGEDVQNHCPLIRDGGEPDIV